MSGVSGSNNKIGSGGGGSASGGASGSNVTKPSTDGAAGPDGVDEPGAVRAVPAPERGATAEPIGGASGSGGSDDIASGPKGGASGSNDLAADGDG